MTSPAHSHYYRQLQPIDAVSEDRVVRLLLFGNCQECDLFDVPESSDELEFFRQVTETILALANSFGGWLILGVSRTWLGNLEALERDRHLVLKDILTSRPTWLRRTVFQNLSDAINPVETETIFGEPGQTGLGYYLTATKLGYFTYSPQWNRSRSESVEKLLEKNPEGEDFLTSFEIELPGEGKLLALRVSPLVDGELSHKEVKRGETVIRVGDRNDTRHNLTGINWAIYQSLRRPARDAIHPGDTQFERFLFGDSERDPYDRLRARALLLEFLNTYRSDRRTDLALELTSLCWQQLGDRDLFRTALETLYTVELGGRHINEQFWRDHVVHTFYTFLLGIYLWDSCPPLRTKLEENPEGSKIWAMTATCHDLGYPFELFMVSLLSQLREMAPQSSGRHPVFPRIKDLGKHQGMSYWQLISQRLWPDKDSTQPLLEVLFDAKSQDISILDHGIVSALLWLSLIAKVSKGLIKPDKATWVLEVAAAIAAHNLSRTDLQRVQRKVNSVQKLRSFQLDTQPFPILLALCDTLQEWDRMAAARHVLIPGAVQVEIVAPSLGDTWEIVARFGLDSRVAAGIGKVFSGEEACFSLGKNLQLRTESFSQALTAFSDATMYAATQDPWMKKTGAHLLMNFEFIKVGSVVSQPEPRKVYLDVGNLCTTGVIDNHAGRHLAATALLVYDHPELVTKHVGHLPPGQVTLILHERPDLDAVAAAFFCQELLVRGEIPTAWRPLARYIDRHDRGLLPIEWNFPSTPWGIFNAFLKGVDAHRHRVRRGFMVLRYLTRWLEQQVNDPEADPTLCFQDAFSGAHPFERLQVEAGKDYDTYRDIFRKGEIQVLELELPMFPSPSPSQPMTTTKTRLLIKPARQKKPDSYFFPQWAALEGYAATLTYHREPGFNQQGKFEPGSLIIGSLSPTGSRERPTFWGLGIYLDEKEDEVRPERGGPDRSAPPNRPPHYGNNDPWYDLREGDIPGGLTASPREGTYLSQKEIETCLRDTATWIKRGEAWQWVLDEPEQ